MDPTEAMPRRRRETNKTGRPAGRLTRRLRQVLLVVLAACIILPATGLLAYRVFPVHLTPLMLIRLTEGEERRQEWTRLSDLPPALVRSVIASEDARFCAHHGFDWIEIERAWTTWRTGGRLRGASTLSMQTARSVFLWPGRDPARKALEAALTVPLEALWPKRRILEVYLNVAEWGPGVYGAQAAARYHFGHDAAALGSRQAALLTAILPAPRAWSAASPGPHVRRRASTIQARAQHVRLGASNTPCTEP